MGIILASKWSWRRDQRPNTDGSGCFPSPRAKAGPESRSSSYRERSLSCLPNPHLIAKNWTSNIVTITLTDKGKWWKASDESSGPLLSRFATLSFCKGGLFRGSVRVCHFLKAVRGGLLKEFLLRSRSATTVFVPSSPNSVRISRLSQLTRGISGEGSPSRDLEGRRVPPPGGDSQLGMHAWEMRAVRFELSSDDDDRLPLDLIALLPRGPSRIGSIFGRSPDAFSLALFSLQTKFLLFLISQNRNMGNPQWLMIF